MITFQTKLTRSQINNIMLKKNDDLSKNDKMA